MSLTLCQISFTRQIIVESSSSLEVRHAYLTQWSCLQMALVTAYCTLHVRPSGYVTRSDSLTKDRPSHRTIVTALDLTF